MSIIKPVKPTLAMVLAFCNPSASHHKLDARLLTLAEPGKNLLSPWYVQVPSEIGDEQPYIAAAKHAHKLLINEDRISSLRKQALIWTSFLPLGITESETHVIRIFALSRIVDIDEIRVWSDRITLVPLDEVEQYQSRWNLNAWLALNTILRSPTLELILENSDLVEKSRMATVQQHQQAIQ